MSKILIIDDSELVLAMASDALQGAGYEVFTATNGIEANSYIFSTTNRPDLIILDVMMSEPDDGFFLAQKFRREKIKVPIIMYTSISKTTGMDFGKSELVPVDEYVEKPISPDELIEKVKKLLKKRKEESN